MCLLHYWPRNFRGRGLFKKCIIFDIHFDGYFWQWRLSFSSLFIGFPMNAILCSLLALAVVDPLAPG